jgi:hypothetical protein
MNKFCLMKSILIIGLSLLCGFQCTDIPSTGPELPDLIAQFRFVNAAVDVGAVGINVDATSVGTIDFKASTAHLQFNAGSRVIVLSTNDTLRVAMPTYRKGTIIILPKTGVVRDYIRLIERRTFDAAEVDTGVIRLAAAATVTGTLDLTIFNADQSVSITRTLALSEDSGYLALPVGQYTITAVATGDTVGTALATIAATVTNKRQTSVIMGNQLNNLAIISLNDD